ncbi:MAG: DUF421 domain-containing protein [Pirellulales bacterium]
MSQIWHSILIPGLPVIEKILRPILVYAFLVIGLRLAGKRELAQLNPFDLVVLLTLSNTVQNAIIGDDNSVTGGLIGATTLLAVNYLVVRFLYVHPRLDNLVEGRPDVLIEHGRLNHESLKRVLLTKEELAAAAHRQGFASLHEVDRAILETGGAISFFGKDPSPETSRHQEVMQRMNDLAGELGALQKSIAALAKSAT